MLFLILTYGSVAEECRSWTVRAWADSCCTDQAEFAFRQSHCIWSGRERASTVSATPRVSRAVTISRTRQHITGFVLWTTRRRNGHCRSTIWIQSLLLVDYCQDYANIAIIHIINVELAAIKLVLITFHCSLINTVVIVCKWLFCRHRRAYSFVYIEVSQLPCLNTTTKSSWIQYFTILTMKS